MWLSKPERRLLVALLRAGVPPRCLVVALGHELITTMDGVSRSGLTVSLPAEFAVDEMAGESTPSVQEGEVARLVGVLAALSDRRLIRADTNAMEYHGHAAVWLTLEVAGHDLARKYSHWFTWSGEWFKDQHGTWFARLADCVASFGFGILTGLVLRGCVKPPEPPAAAAIHEVAPASTTPEAD